MARYLGRHLMVKGSYVDSILEGRKRTTIRLGIVKPKYNEIIIHGGGKPVAKARITRVVYKKVSELTDRDARLDGFRNKGELLDELKKHYPGLREDDTITIIEFEVIQRLDNLEAHHPYMGLKPPDLARLALRYLRDLSEDERRVLLDLTRTGSIRLTAIRLYGNLDARWRVRKVLKRALKRLLEQGLLGSRKER